MLVEETFLPFTGNVDYHETQLTLTFPSGSTGGVRIPFSVSLVDDNIAERQEHFTITASTSGNGIGIYSRTTYGRFTFIRDDDRELLRTVLYAWAMCSCTVYRVDNALVDCEGHCTSIAKRM